jgi:hypothetical protein
MGDRLIISYQSGSDLYTVRWNREEVGDPLFGDVETVYVPYVGGSPSIGSKTMSLTTVNPLTGEWLPPSTVFGVTVSSDGYFLGKIRVGSQKSWYAEYTATSSAKGPVSACPSTDFAFFHTDAGMTVSVFRETEGEPETSFPGTVALFDMNADGALDAVLLSHAGTGLLENVALSTSPSFSLNESTVAGRQAGFTPRDYLLTNVHTAKDETWVPAAGEGATFADLTGNGYTDIFRHGGPVVNYPVNGTVLLENQGGSGSFVAYPVGDIPGRNLPRQFGYAYQSHLVTFDCNNDGLLDFFLTEQAHHEDGLRVALSPGVYSNRTRYVDQTEGRWRILDYVVPGDMNGDGYIDLVVSYDAAFWEPMVMMGRGDCLFDKSDWIFGAFNGSACHRAAVLDIQNDGALDVVCGQQVFFGDPASLEGTVMKVHPVGAGLRKGGLDVRVELWNAANDTLLGLRVSSSAQGGQQPSTHLHFGVPFGIERLLVVALFQPVGGGPLVRREVHQCRTGQLDLAVWEEAPPSIFCHDPPSVAVSSSRAGGVTSLSFVVEWETQVEGETMVLSIDAPAEVKQQATDGVATSTELRWTGTAERLSGLQLNLTADAPGTYAVLIKLAVFADTPFPQEVETTLTLEVPSVESTPFPGGSGGGLGPGAGPGVAASEENAGGEEGLGVGAIVGIILGVLALCVLIVVAVLVARKRRKRKGPSVSLGPTRRAGPAPSERPSSRAGGPAPVGGLYGALPAASTREGVTYETLEPSSTYDSVSRAQPVGGVYDGASSVLAQRGGGGGGSNRFELSEYDRVDSRSSQYESVSAPGLSSTLPPLSRASATPSRGSTYDSTSSIMM